MFLMVLSSSQVYADLSNSLYLLSSCWHLTPSMFLAMFHHSLLVCTKTASGFSPAMRSLVLFARRVEELVVPIRYKVRPLDGSFNTVKVFLKGSNLREIVKINEANKIYFCKKSLSKFPWRVSSRSNHFWIGILSLLRSPQEPTKKPNRFGARILCNSKNQRLSLYLVPALWKMPVSRLGFLRNLWTALALIISLFSVFLSLFLPYLLSRIY